MADPIEVTNDKLQFSQFHQPSLKTGLYQVVVTHQISTNEPSQPKIPQTVFSTTRNFQVAGERFSLDPKDIYAVYPPDGSLSDHSTILPHLILNRSTLPWERQADPNNEDLPWLSLLMFTADQTPVAQTMTLGELQQSANAGVKFPSFTLEPGQTTNDRVLVIDVAKQLLADLLPSNADLGYQAHIRQSIADDGTPTGQERAVILGNRLPGPNQINTVFLVSLENRYTSTGFDFQQASDSDLIRLVVLSSWRFASPPAAQQQFADLMLGLNHSPSNLRLATNTNPLAERYAAQGYALLPHSMRQANQSISWYRGPLGVGQHTAQLALPALAADSLLAYDSTTGMFDVSYAAAWELGRLMVLQTKQISTSLYAWKRGQIQQKKSQNTPTARFQPQRLQSRSLATAAPADVQTWFQGLAQLQGVPFNYLVPDETMLPNESIRFFRLDPNWMACLFDGALSIGRATTGDLTHEQALDLPTLLGGLPTVTGFIMRSAVVAGWPNIIIEACDAAEAKIDQIRLETLADSVLIGLFDGDLASINFKLHAETMHFGFDPATQQYPNLHKQLRDASGAETNQVVTSVPWHNEAYAVVALAQLANAMQQLVPQATFTSAQFALQMIEGSESVCFKHG